MSSRRPLLALVLMLFGASVQAEPTNSGAAAAAPTVETTNVAETALAPSANEGPSAEGAILAENPVIEHRQIGHNATSQEIASLLRLGHSHFASGDYASAVMAFMQVLAEDSTPEQIHEALLNLARTYRKKADFTKAAAVYERFVKDYPADQELPAVYLELGRTFRALGASKQAISQFYSVLNSTLKLPDIAPSEYRQLARTAQFEIAETYFQTGDYVQANRYFSRLKLLDLAPEDRARAQFKAAFALALARDDENAVSSLQAYLTQYPGDENVPEARYLLSVSLRQLGRTQESLRATLDLLKVESSHTTTNPERWAYWQRKTGNQLANEFYQTGDFTSALAIYQSLAQLSQDAAWSVPVTYQIGLCFERLRSFDRAREAYKSIVDRLKDQPAIDQSTRELADLAEMAAWRLSQLNWQVTTDNQVSELFTSPLRPHQLGVNSTTKSATHDVHGSPPIASDSLR